MLQNYIEDIEYAIKDSSIFTSNYIDMLCKKFSDLVKENESLKQELKHIIKAIDKQP